MRRASEPRGRRNGFVRNHRWLAVVAAVAPVAAAAWLPESVSATTLTWDASGAANGFTNFPTDGSGSWNTSISPNWNPGGVSADQTWLDGSAAVIGAGSGAAGKINIDNGSVIASGLQFNAPGSGGNYTINGATL